MECRSINLTIRMYGVWSCLKDVKMTDNNEYYWEVVIQIINVEISLSELRRCLVKLLQDNVEKVNNQVDAIELLERSRFAVNDNIILYKNEEQEVVDLNRKDIKLSLLPPYHGG